MRGENITRAEKILKVLSEGPKLRTELVKIIHHNTALSDIIISLRLKGYNIIRLSYNIPKYGMVGMYWLAGDELRVIQRFEQLLEDKANIPWRDLCNAILGTKTIPRPSSGSKKPDSIVEWLETKGI